MDQILIKNLRVNCIVGWFEHERVTPQELVIHLGLLLDTRTAAFTDDLKDTADFRIALKVKEFVECSKFKLLESLAEDVARFCLSAMSVKRVTVSIEKCLPDMPGVIGAVEIARERI